MASIADGVVSAIAIEEYLENFSYRPDVEYVDGALKERAMVKSVHGSLQTALSGWFFIHRAEWGIRAGVEIRTRVSASRVRLPDVVVDYKRKWPPTLVEPPLIVIEIPSPTDSYTETKELAREYIEMGVPNIWLVDPERRACEMYVNGAWVEAQRLELRESPIYVDMAEMFAILDADDVAQ